MGLQLGGRYQMSPSFGSPSITTSLEQYNLRHLVLRAFRSVSIALFMTTTRKQNMNH